MTIKEEALHSEVDVVAYIGSTWTPLIADATGLTIRRGGERNGLGIKTDVGLCTFTLKDAQDPLADGALAPGMPVKVVAGPGYVPAHDTTKYSHGFEGYAPPSTKYSFGFETAVSDGWTSNLTTSAVISSSPHSGTYCWYEQTSTQSIASVASRTITGLVVGRSYTLSAWWKGGYNGNLISIGVNGVGASTPSAQGSGTWVQFTYTFTATATSHVLELKDTSTADAFHYNFWDDIVLADNGFTAADGWGAAIGTIASFGGGSVAKTGSFSMGTYRSTSGQVQAKRTMTGLTSGRSYTATVWAFRSLSTITDAKVGVTGKSYGTPVSPSIGGWGQVTYTFTATATSHELLLEATTGANQVVAWDDILLIEHVPIVDNRAPIFTGRIAHLNSVYPLNKGTNESRAVVTVTVADAVQIHVSTMRYGVDLGVDTNETFEERIERLEGSANAPVEVPEVGEPIVRYAF